MIRIGNCERSHSSLTDRYQPLATFLTSPSDRRRPLSNFLLSTVIPSFSVTLFSAPCRAIATHIAAASQQHVCNRMVPLRLATGIRIQHSKGMLCTALMGSEMRNQPRCQHNYRFIEYEPRSLCCASLLKLFRNWFYIKRERDDDVCSSCVMGLFCISPVVGANLLRVMRRAVGVLCAVLIFITFAPVQRASAFAIGRHEENAGVSMVAKAGSRGKSKLGGDAPVVIFDRDFATRLESDSWWNDISGLSILTPEKGERRDAVDASRGLSLPSPTLGMEARILARLLVALVVGGIIGMERRAANSLAGVRTFSLVSLGAAIFMSTTLVAFPTADPTRVAAAISSSVGFLGAGAMHKNSKQSRGLTTASSVWLAAALGIAAASGLFLLSFSGAVATVLIARYARFDSSLHLIRRTRVHDQDSLDVLEHEVDDITGENVVDELQEAEDVRISGNIASRRAFRNRGRTARGGSRNNIHTHWDDEDEGSSGIQDCSPRHPLLDE